jgi:heat shock protein HslJ
MRDIRILPFVIAALLLSCKSAPDASSGANGPVQGEASENAVDFTPAPEFGGITGKEWKLTGVRALADNAGSNAAMRFSRRELVKAGMENAYTLRFDGERLSGAAAPNRYSAPYTRGAGQTLSIRAIAATLMAAMAEPENLKEREYFGYLENVEKWDLVQGRLQLISRNERDEEIILVFETGLETAQE